MNLRSLLRTYNQAGDGAKRDGHEPAEVHVGDDGAGDGREVRYRAPHEQHRLGGDGAQVVLVGQVRDHVGVEPESSNFLQHLIH